MKVVICRGTLIQSAQGAPTHADADETPAGHAPLAPACGAVLASATLLDGCDKCVVDRYLCCRAHGRSPLAGAPWAGASGALRALYPAPLAHTQSRASHRICCLGMPPPACMAGRCGGNMALALGGPLLC